MTFDQALPIAQKYGAVYGLTSTLEILQDMQQNIRQLERIEIIAYNALMDGFDKLFNG